MLIRVILTGEDPEDNREYDTSAVSGIPVQKLQEMARKKKFFETNNTHKKFS